jgi:prolyl 4-hydroxylase
MTEVNLGGANTFIGGWFVPELDVCDELIAYFQASTRKVDGAVGSGQVDKEIKDSTDLRLDYDQFTDPPVAHYLHNLRRVCEQYVGKYQASAAVDGWGITEKINIQHYAPGGGYKIWHCERWGKEMPAAARHLVFMTYLNDVHDAGGTEFLHQQLVVQPRRGLTLIWPADWTHHHRGIVSPSEEKYIITGWFSFT